MRHLVEPQPPCPQPQLPSSSTYSHPVGGGQDGIKMLTIPHPLDSFSMQPRISSTWGSKLAIPSQVVGPDKGIRRGVVLSQGSRNGPDPEGLEKGQGDGGERGMGVGGGQEEGRCGLGVRFVTCSKNSSMKGNSVHMDHFFLIIAVFRLERQRKAGL